MLTFQVPIYRKIRGFTLLELIIAVLLISIFLTFASVNWNFSSKKDKDSLLENFSIGISVAREEAIADYEKRIIEFDITANKVNIGLVNEQGVFVLINELVFLQDYTIKDVVINGEAYPTGKCYMTIYSNGMADRTIIHLEGEDNYYTLLVNSLTAKVTGEIGHFEEIQFGDRNKSS